LRSGPADPTTTLTDEIGRLAALVQARADYPEIRATVREARFPADGETPADLLTKLGLGREASPR
jgi:hypothetical protein